MKVDWKTSDLAKYIPHRAPLVWVDRVIEISESLVDFAGSCWTEIHGDSLFIDERGKVPGVVAVECIGQAYGYARACFHHVHNIDNTPKRTYLAGIRSCETFFNNYRVQESRFFQTDVKIIRTKSQMTFIEGHIFCPDQQVTLAKAQLQIYTN